MIKINLNNIEPVNNYEIKNFAFEYVSRLANGFNEGELITIAARTGCGKSTTARNLLTYFNKEGFKTLLVSSEETAREISYKLKNICSILSIDFNNKTFYLENENLNIQTIERDIKESKAKFVFVDYIQQLEGNIRDNTKLLKKLALKYKCIIFMLSQLNRGAINKIPDETTISKSDNILHDSDQVWLMHNTTMKDTQDGDIIMLEVIKNRKGETGKTFICLDKNDGVFFDLEPAFWAKTMENYTNILADRCPSWAKKIIESIENIESPKVNVEKPWLVLKNGLIL